MLKKILLFVVVLSFSTPLFSQNKVTISGNVKENNSKNVIAYANVVLKSKTEKAFVVGTATNDNGFFTISNVTSGNYFLEISSIGYLTYKEAIYIGTLSNFINLKTILLTPDVTSLSEIVIDTKQDEISAKMDKKTYSLKDNINQSGGSVLQAMQNLPSVSVLDGKVKLRGNDKVIVLIDGKQTALTGFGNQAGLDNIPSSAIDRIEVINNPSSKYDANGNGGIINIIYKKNKVQGFNGKVGFTGGLGALWERKENLPSIRPQYSATPKINPSLSLNYRKNNINVFFQGDYLYTETLNKNEFVTRTYDDGTIIKQQSKRNRDTHFSTLKSGIDWNIDNKNSFTFSGLYGTEVIIDNGDQPFFNEDLSNRLRLWQFLEDEVKITAMATANFVHKFKEAGHNLTLGFNYTFHREDEKYFFDNILPNEPVSENSFKLLSDEQVYDFNIDYVKPLKYGKMETGLKFRKRNIPINMQFFPGTNTPLDIEAGGEAEYKELIPAVYGNYIFENEKYEAEIGLRIEYVDLNYNVNPDHNTYKNGGYDYFEPFPNVRFAKKIDENNKISIFYNRRVDRPNEVDIRIFPKYDDAEIIKVGNPNLRPQFTNLLELGYKTNWNSGSLYSAIYHRFADGTITRISSSIGNDPLIYAIFQNAGKSSNSGLEMVYEQEVSDSYSFNLNGNIYQNKIDAFSVVNLYPSENIFSADQQKITSGTLKLNNTFHFSNKLDAQLTASYLAPDIIPQGRRESMFSLDLGLKKSIQKGKGELFFNATDLLNTMVIKKTVEGQGFSYTSNNYYETQVIRLGYTYKF
ncbi:TonB-dependent receptor family protein [Polaribacter sp. Z014]|uniref:outer membrane beta-barrel family protein n=1 Tax=Polaribacter sp. Z014 TaxID=2927126 RepID=UPI00201FCE7B|nr:outer membrane beta-barrel family protein [Polaribacter sp. Z014]MCL7765005.1 TonB-dependent receptor family protein [Polaribacter sp. Z014]